LAYTNTAGTSQNGYYSTSSGSCASKTEVTGVANPWVFSGTNGTPYYFQGTNVNSAGESTCSSEVSATPSAPTKQGGYSGTLTASNVGQVGPSGGADTIMQNYSLTASTITEAKIENYYATWSGNGTTAWIRFKVWRLSGGVYTLIGTTPEISMQTTNGLQTYTFTGIACQTGDLIGFSTNAAGASSPYGAVDTLAGSETWYSKVGDITSGTVAQSGMTTQTTYSNMQIQFWGN
jgi:cellulose 1,4-beta-cellobiosidase